MCISAVGGGGDGTRWWRPPRRGVAMRAAALAAGCGLRL